jgi:hypothetical protein
MNEITSNGFFVQAAQLERNIVNADLADGRQFVLIRTVVIEDVSEPAEAESLAWVRAISPIVAEHDSE